MVTKLEALSVPGGRGRAACARVDEIAGALAAALRRAVPFLSASASPSPRSRRAGMSFAELASDGSIVHASSFTARAAGGASPSAASVRGLVLFDEIALARILDGVFGGDGSPMASSAAPTSAQSALASRVTGSMLRAFGQVLASRLSLAIEPAASKNIEAGAAVILALVMDGGGKVILAHPALRGHERRGDPGAIRISTAASLRR